MPKKVGKEQKAIGKICLVQHHNLPIGLAHDKDVYSFEMP